MDAQLEQDKDTNNKLSIKVIKEPFGSQYYADGMDWELNGENMSAAILAVVAKHYLHENNVTHLNINGEDIEVDSLFDNDALKEKVPYIEYEDFNNEDTDENTDEDEEMGWYLG